MVIKLYKLSREAYFLIYKGVGAAAKFLAELSCTDNLQLLSLSDCYNDAARISGQIYKMTETPNHSVGYLRDFFEMRPEGFSSFTDLMSFWAKADAAFPKDDEARQEYSDAFRVLGAAKGFCSASTELSSLTCYFLNASLALNGDILVRHIEQKSREFLSIPSLSAPT